MPGWHLMLRVAPEGDSIPLQPTGVATPCRHAGPRVVFR